MNNDKETANKIREFNRFYTNIIGVVNQHILNSDYTLTEVRTLYEIYFTENCSAKMIKEYLNIDWGYLSRILNKFVKKGFIIKKTSKEDKRLSILTLSSKGEKEFLKLNQNSENEVLKMISKLSSAEKNELTELMERIKSILSKQ